VDAFDPGSLLVWETFDEGEYIQARECGERAREGNEDRGRDHLACARVLRTRAHEWSHYSQYVSTTFGLARWTLENLRAQAFLAFASDLFASGHATRLTDLVVPQDERMQRAHEEGIPRRARSSYSVWHAADLLLAVLWAKSTTVEAMSAAADTVTAAIEDFPDAGRLRIESRGSWNAQLGPYGTVSVELVSEGLAKFCELWGLLHHFGPDEAMAIWQANRSRLGGYTHDLIGGELEIGLFHPMIGALLDACLACPPDLFGDDELFVWERDHPGLRLRRAVKRLKTMGVPRDMGLEEAYEMALVAVDVAPSALVASHRAAAARARVLLDNLDDAPEFVRNADPLIILGQGELFARAMEARAGSPDAVWHGFHTGAHIDQVAIVPPLLTQPNGLACSMLDGVDTLMTVGGQAAFMQMATELQEEGRLDRTRRLARLAPSSWNVGYQLSLKFRLLSPALAEAIVAELNEEDPP
jgi:hypothetical protein